jgi:undecaprenyldiphospho-muramoylpentapeptide beta-N-acetylglucosaminyltransferase
MASETFAVIAGGGTAGHVLPALAVADALVRAGHDRTQIHYTGAVRGIETRLMPGTGYDFTLFEVTGVPTRPSIAALKSLVRLARARRHAIALLRRLKPRVVVSVGGYASLPSVLAARRLSIPVVVVSYDAIPGRASRLAARRAAACAVAFEDSPLPRAEFTGAPVRSEILAIDRSAQRDAARTELGIPRDRFAIGVIGGSQGSGSLNTAVWAMASTCADDATLAIYHVVGERFIDSVPADVERDPSPGAVWYRALGYEPNMPAVYAACDLIIGRGGASTVHEIAVTGTPAILVPWAAAAEDHQRANVASLADHGAAVLVDESQLAGLGGVVAELREEPSRLADLAERAHRRGTRHRGSGLATLIESVALA